MEKVQTFKEYVIKRVKNQLSFKKFDALTDVSFNVQKGEVVGIVGLNGSGKSTLLKLISGIIKPTKGKIKVNGSISPLIELGAGFNSELTARENIFLNGAVLGYSRNFIKKKFKEIVEFSEMKDFLDVPMKNYSSGMVARVAFAVATIVKPEILIVDEILAVGDFKFREKCLNRIRDIIERNATVVIVSHDLDQIREICSRVIWIEKGVVKKIGTVEEICSEYEET